MTPDFFSKAEIETKGPLLAPKKGGHGRTGGVDGWQLCGEGSTLLSATGGGRNHEKWGGDFKENMGNRM